MSTKDKLVCTIIVVLAVVVVLVATNYAWDKDPSFSGSGVYEPNYIGEHVK